MEHWFQHLVLWQFGWRLGYQLSLLQYHLGWQIETVVPGQHWRLCLYHSAFPFCRMMDTRLEVLRRRKTNWNNWKTTDTFHDYKYFLNWNEILYFVNGLKIKTKSKRFAHSEWKFINFEQKHGFQMMY